jgi:hypothetical protein
MSKHDTLPCGCKPAAKHVKGCLMWRPGFSTAVYQCEAVVAMFEQLNEIWFIAHPVYERGEQHG